MEFTARCAAEVAAGGGFSPWLSLLPDHWKRERRLSAASMDRLQALWSDSQPGDDDLKRQAFRLWLTGARRAQLDALLAIPPDSPLTPLALRTRALLGDETAASTIAPLFRADTSWANAAAQVWSPELQQAATEHLQAFETDIPGDFVEVGAPNKHYDLFTLLRMIPQTDADRLLQGHWGHLRLSSLFVQAALYVGTQACRELAAVSIATCPLEVPILRYVGMRFGFLEDGAVSPGPEQLESLRPHVGRLDENDLAFLAQACERIGATDWGHEHLMERLSANRRRQYYPSDEQLREDLSEFAGGEGVGPGHVHNWLEGFERRRDPDNRAMRVVDAWLASHRTLRGLKVAAACIAMVGRRRDLAILNRYSIDGPLPEIVNIKRSAVFSVRRRSLE